VSASRQATTLGMEPTSGRVPLTVEPRAVSSPTPARSVPDTADSRPSEFTVFDFDLCANSLDSVHQTAIGDRHSILDDIENRLSLDYGPRSKVACDRPSLLLCVCSH
jgi:hypothetical protein